MVETNQGYGQQDPTSGSSDFNQTTFIVEQILAGISTAKVVKVLAVDATATPPSVDVQIMVNQVDGQGNATPHGKIYAVPYLQLQWGDCAVIGTPAVDDKGLLICCDRDISAVKSTQGIANPGSFRQFSAADGIYIGGILNGGTAIKQFVKFTDQGLDIEDRNGNKIVSSSTGWEFTGPVKFGSIVTMQQNLQLAGNVLGGNGGIYAGNFHTSGGVQADAGVTSAGIGLTSHHHTAQGATAPTTGPQA